MLNKRFRTHAGSPHKEIVFIPIKPECDFSISLGVTGDITRDPKRNREIAFWFNGYEHNFFMWRPGMGAEPLVEHFFKYLSSALE